jgi:hypothetical protein
MLRALLKLLPRLLGPAQLDDDRDPYLIDPSPSILD